MKNTISVKAYLVDGGEMEILNDANPSQAIEQYLLPDTRPPVQTLVFAAYTDEGKLIKLSFTQKSITFSVIDSV